MISKTLLVLMIAVLLVSTAIATDDSTVVTDAPHYASLDEARAANTDNRNILIDFYSDS